jgi:plasmid maintenance system antidote protein VapI
MSPEFWMGLQADYEMALARDQLGIPRDRSITDDREAICVTDETLCHIFSAAV